MTIFNKLKCLSKDYKIFLFRGDLGAGKTTFIKQFTRHLGLDLEIVSPTFGMLHEHDNDIYHYDIFRKSLDEVLSIGLLNLLERDGLHFVEWGGEDLANVLMNVGFSFVIVEIKVRDNERIFHIEEFKF